MSNSSKSHHSLHKKIRISILYPGNHETRRSATSENNRFANLFRAFAERHIHVESAVYHDDFRDEVRAQIIQCDAVLVWVNPVHEGRDRTLLDAMLRDVAASGVFVSTHPDIILKLGTKEVLYDTRMIGWSCDTHRYMSMKQMTSELPVRLAEGKARVLKQVRGNGGDGVWKVQLPTERANDYSRQTATLPHTETIVRVRHAKKGCIEEEIPLGAFYDRCQPYFLNNGRMIDQEYQERLTEGMVRCYLVHDTVAGFGHQEVNALYPPPPGAPPKDAPQPGPRLYHPPSMPVFQHLKQQLETEWVPAAQRLLDIETARLPVLWDCDFLLGPKTTDGEDTYVLCEINVSSVAPYPESVVPFVVDATLARITAH